MNQINVIHPYCNNGVWVFDDKEMGANKEALVGGTPEVIGLACQEFGVKDPFGGFTILFSHTWFKDSQFSCKWIEGDSNGNTYLWDRNGVKAPFWLCNFLLKYFENPPQELFIRVQSRPGV